MGIFDFLHRKKNISDNVSSLDSLKAQKDLVIQKSAFKISNILIPKINEKVKYYSATNQYGLNLVFTLDHEFSKDELKSIIHDNSPYGYETAYSYNSSLQDAVLDKVVDNITNTFKAKGYIANQGTKFQGLPTIWISEPETNKTSHS